MPCKQGKPLLQKVWRNKTIKRFQKNVIKNYEESFSEKSLFVNGSRLGKIQMEIDIKS